jgi:hypothetical protein
VTDLKTANMMLAEAIAALESPEHDADVNEAEAIRERLLDLDAAIGERIQAKLDAHRLIIDQWGVSEVVVPRLQGDPEKPLVMQHEVKPADRLKQMVIQVAERSGETGIALPN